MPRWTIILAVMRKLATAVTAMAATDTAKIETDAPRDRQGNCDPQLIARYQRRFPGFDDKILSMYARGMSTREITGYLYDVDVSPNLISTVTDAVLEEVAAWQQRPLDAAYPLVFFDAIRVKICDEGMVRNNSFRVIRINGPRVPSLGPGGVLK